MSNYDVVVIGAGPGGYVTAIRAAQLGLKTAIVEREHLGGICLNWGCIPTKALLRSSEVFHLMERAKEFGLKAENIGYDLDAVVQRSRGVAKQLSGGVGHLLKKNKVEVIMGEARVAAPGKVLVKTDKGEEKGMDYYEPRSFMFCRFLHHPGLASIQFATFFHMCRLESVSYDMEKRAGSTFALYDCLQSGVVALLTIGEHRKVTVNFMMEALNFIQNQVGASALTLLLGRCDSDEGADRRQRAHGRNECDGHLLAR